MVQPAERGVCRLACLLALGLCAALPALAQQGRRAEVFRDSVRDQASAVLALMTYMVVPDVTTSSLSVGNNATGNPSISMTQLGGGFTWSKATPFYMEGNLAYIRFDPKFLVSDGTEQRTVPVKWNAVNLSTGFGWDFPINKDLVIRPIAMFSIGRILSDVEAGLWFIAEKTGSEADFLDGGKLREWGAGGAIMLDLERLRPERDIDLEVRYTNVRLHTRSSASAEMNAEATAENLNIWARLRTPTGAVLLDRPLRSVLELTHTNFLGSQGGLLGFDNLTSVGVGLELELSAHEVFVTRARVVARYLRGENVEGWSLGLAVSF